MNPWATLSAEAPFILETDRPPVTDFNKKRRAFTRYWIHTGRTPEPRLGPVDAPIVLLQLNASYDQQKREKPLTPSEIAKNMDNLANEDSAHPCLAESNQWWDSAFGQLIKKFDRKRLANRVCSIEYFAYPSARFGHKALQIPSQCYQLSLVQRALDRGSIIIVTRGLDLWAEKIPGIRPKLGKTVFESINRQRVWLTSGNLSSKAFNALCEAI